MKLMRTLFLLPAVLSALFFVACRKEVSLEGGTTAIFELQDVFGDCLGDTAVGNYVAGTALNGDSSYVRVRVHVLSKGRYSLNTDIQNGFSFTGSGNFPDTGYMEVRIPARGTPGTVGITTFRIAKDSVYCEFNVNVTATPQAGGTCGATVNGSYYKDTTLRLSNNVSLSHNYAGIGTYNIITDTINGYHFEGLVNITSPGVTNISLDGVGTPVATGTNNFTVRFGDGTTCGFPVTVTAPPPPAGGCGTVNGAYTAGTALGAGNTITISNHSFAMPAAYTVRTNTVNGISFGPATVTTTGPNATPAITLNGTGTPAAAGNYSFTIDFGDGTTCTVQVTVATGGTTPSGDYFPLSANSWWSYNNTMSSGDTITRRNEYSNFYNGQSYRVFGQFNQINNRTDSFFYRKDATTGYTIEAYDIEDLGTGLGVTFPAGLRAEIPIVKDAVTTGQTWLSPAYSGNSGGNNVQFRLAMQVTDAAATVTVNGNTFTNVHVIGTTIEYNMGFGWQPFPFGSTLRTQWFAPNVGLIKELLPFPTTPMELRNYRVF